MAEALRRRGRSDGPRPRAGPGPHPQDPQPLPVPHPAPVPRAPAAPGPGPHRAGHGLPAPRASSWRSTSTRSTCFEDPTRGLPRTARPRFGRRPARLEEFSKKSPESPKFNLQSGHRGIFRRVRSRPESATTGLMAESRPERAGGREYGPRHVFGLRLSTPSGIALGSRRFGLRTATTGPDPVRRSVDLPALDTGAGIVRAHFESGRRT